MEKKKILLTEFYLDSANDLVLDSHVLSSSKKGKKNVMFLATYRPFLGITTDDGKSDAMLYELYDFTKVLSEITDQRKGFYPRKVKSRNWLMVAFAYILDKVRVNASTLFSLNNKKEDPSKQDSFVFGMSVVLGLVGPFIRQRNQSKLSPCAKAKTAMDLGIMHIQETSRSNL